jgi:hypothetical protein
MAIWYTLLRLIHSEDFTIDVARHVKHRWTCAQPAGSFGGPRAACAGLNKIKDGDETMEYGIWHREI